MNIPYRSSKLADNACIHLKKEASLFVLGFKFINFGAVKVDQDSRWVCQAYSPPFRLPVITEVEVHIHYVVNAGSLL